MTTGVPPPSANATWPRVLRYCKRCQKETPHEIHLASGMSVTVCVPCLTKALNFELDKD